MTYIRNWIEKQGLQIVSQPLSLPVMSIQDHYLGTEGLYKLGWRVLRRKFFLWISGQSICLKDRADFEWRKGLWIYFRTAQIGDSIMDLSARSFFQDVNCSVDLFTNVQIEKLYKDDEWFDVVTSNYLDIKNIKYDFIIIQSVHHRALKYKIKYFRNMPWICMQSFYDVPDFARSKWGVQRLVDLWSFNNLIDSAKYGWHSKQKLSYNTKFCTHSRKRVTVVLGGMDPVRTYHKWHEVIRGLKIENNQSITLIGIGQEALEGSDQILLVNPTLNIASLVNQLSLDDLKDILLDTKLLLVADGGAMHMGIALDIPAIVSLFIRGIPPPLRIPDSYHEFAVTSHTGLINDIPSDQIINKANFALNCKFK